MTEYEILLQKHNILAEVQKLIQRQQEIIAIKTVRDTTGLSLKESKEIVDHISRSPFTIAENFDHTNELSISEIIQKNDIEQQLHILLKENRKLEAIKLVIDNTGMGLLSAKNLVESIQNGETTFNPETLEDFSDIGVKMINNNGKITVKIKEGTTERVIYPNDPKWKKVKKMLGHKTELQNYETDFLNGKYPVPQKKSNLFVETNSAGKWILFLVLFFIIMLFIYFLYPKN